MPHSPSKVKSCRRENLASPPFDFAVIRANHQPAAIVRRTATTANTVHVRQILASTSSILSPPARRFPGPGCRGAEASAQWRQEEPASEDSQLPSDRTLADSAITASQSAGGASSLKTLASIVFRPFRKNFDTSSVEICFQFPVASVCTVSPLIFNSIRLAARTSNRADPGCDSTCSVRRNVASIVATGCVRASIAAGNTIHSARLSRGRKLIFGSRSHFHASHPKAMVAAATKASAVQNVFNGTNLVSVAAWKKCVPGGIRTPNLLIRSQMLYPVELQTQN